MDSISFGKLYYKLLKDDLSKSSIILFTILASNSMQKGYAYGTNKYYNSNQGIECYQVSIGSIKKDKDILLNEKDKIVNAIADVF